MLVFEPGEEIGCQVQIKQQEFKISTKGKQKSAFIHKLSSNLRDLFSLAGNEISCKNG